VTVYAGYMKRFLVGKPVTIRLIVNCLVVMILGGCSHHTSDDRKSENYQDSYQFKLDTCNTGLHRFSSDNSDELKRQLCEALQNDRLNNSCAESSRRELFRERCSGLSWNPYYGSEPEPRPVPTPGPLPGPVSPEHIKAVQIQKALENLVIQSYSLAPDLGTQDKRATEDLVEVMIKCGVTSQGPNCFEGHSSYATGDDTTVDEGNGMIQFYSELNIGDFASPIIFAFTLEPAYGPSLKVTQLEVLKVVRPKGIKQTYADYFRDRSHFKRLMVAKVDSPGRP
jgi:hypothetical protein